jgi:alkanesulfonate monooxygenase SsuD/methylene tetrahydromethanopterin reductase-like flavin-dependent oxidoreductase (luciferase family)
MVSNLNLRHPLALAKDAMTIDHISAGRLTLGLGAGGVGLDATVFGQPQLTPTQRVERLSEAAYLIDGVLRDQLHDHSGAFYEVSGARLLPGCVQQPRLPLAIAAGRSKSLQVAAEYGDAWITHGDTSYREVTAAGTERVVNEQSRQLDDHCQMFGRDPAEIDRIYLIGNTEARPLSSVGAFEEFMGRYAELGFTDLVFHMPRVDDPVWNESPEVVEKIAEKLLQR